MSEQPYDFAAAVAESRRASEAQHNAENFRAEKVREWAEAERAYRKALAEKIVRLRAEGVAVTAAGDIARGDAEVVELKFKRDLSEGMKEAAAESLWRHNAQRRDLLEFITWSQRAAFLDA